MQLIQNHNETIFYIADTFTKKDIHAFSSEWLEQQGRVTGSAGGRGQALFFRMREQEWVLRHYRRGGMVRHLSEDKFFYTGFKSTRSWQELNLLHWMEQQGLAVPSPVAGRVIKQGLFYQADIIISRIPDARDLAQLLTKCALTEEAWFATGDAVAQMHALNVDHTDLNSHNILLDKSGKVWLIDFDKCGRKAPGDWKQQNLARLKRSFEKEASLHPVFHYDHHCWQMLMTGYQAYR